MKMRLFRSGLFHWWHRYQRWPGITERAMWFSFMSLWAFFFLFAYLVYPALNITSTTVH